MDPRTSTRCEAYRSALSERSDRRGMGPRRANDPAGAAWGSQTLGECARGAKRNFLRALDRLPVEGAAEGPAAKSTVHDYLELWNWDGTLERIHHALYVAVRSRKDVKRAQRQRSSIPRLPKVLKKGVFSRSFGLRRGQKGQGSQAAHPGRHAGSPAERCCSSADIQDRDGTFHLLRRARRLFPFIERIFADGGYRGEKMARVISRTGVWKLEIVKRSTAGFEILPKRWIVERTFAWISRNRRLARDLNVMPPPSLHSSVSP